MRSRKIIGWTLAVLGILIVAGLIGGVLFLKTASFQRLAIRTIVADVNQSTGGRVDIHNFDFQLSTLTAQLYDVTIHGGEAPGQPSLLHIDKLTVGLKILSVLRRKVSVSELLIEHPVVYVQIDRTGKSNLPQSPQEQSSSNTSVFDLAAGHVLLARGEINYNDATVPVEADLYGLKTEIHFEPLKTRYRGSISYDSGRLRYATEPSFPHSLDARFSASPTRFSLESALLKVGLSSVSLHADISNYDHPTMDGHYDLRIHTQDLSTILQPVASAGDVSLSGSMHYQGSDGEPLLRLISIDGQIASDSLTAASSKGRLDLRRLRGHYQLLNGTLKAHDVDFEALGGGVSADVEVRHLDTTVDARIQTTLRAISLEAAQQVLRTAEVKRVTVVGRVDGTVDASWTGSVDKLRARTDLVLRSGGGEASAKGVPDRFTQRTTAHEMP